MQTQTKDASGIQTIKIDTSILKKREFTCLGRVYLLKLETGGLPPVSFHQSPCLVVNPVMHKDLSGYLT